MIQKISESTGGKVGIGVVALAAVGIAVYAIFASSSGSGSGYGKQVSAKEAAVSAQKAIDALKANTHIPEQAKQQQIAHLQAEVDAANGHEVPAAKPPSPGG
jgi:hypothetical protein